MERKIYTVLKAAPWLILVGLLLWLVYILRGVLSPFLLGAVGAYLCEPIVRFMVGRKCPRFIASLFVSGGMFMVVVAILLLIVPLIVGEARLIYEKTPQLITKLQMVLVPWLQETFDIQLDISVIRQWALGNLDVLPTAANWLTHHLLSGGESLLRFVTFIAITPATMFFVLQDWEKFSKYGNQWVPLPMQHRTSRIVSDMGEALRHYLRGQALVMLCLGVYLSIGLSVISLPNAVPLGLFTGLLFLIPYLGYTTGFILALLAAVLHGGGGTLVLGVIVVYLIGQMMETFVLTPLLIGKSLGLHPLMVVFVLLTFAQLFGFLGVLLALPVAAVMTVVVREIRQGYQASDLYRGTHA